jgi:hypothetical protein
MDIESLNTEIPSITSMDPQKLDTNIPSSSFEKYTRKTNILKLKLVYVSLMSSHFNIKNTLEREHTPP